MGHCKSVFSNALISTAITIYQRSSQNQFIRLKILNDENVKRIDDAPYKIVQLDQIINSYGAIQVYADLASNRILQKIIKQSNSLSEIAQVRTGVMGFDYWAMDKWINDINKGCLIATNSYIGRYEFKWGEKVRLYKREVSKPHLDPNCNILSATTMELFSSKKIIIRGVAKCLTAMLDEIGIGMLVAVHSVKSDVYNHKYLLGRLNSTLFNWIHIKQFYSARIPEGSLRYPISFLARLPVRIINFSNPRDVNHHNQMVSLVEHMLSLHQQLANAKTPTEKTLLQRQIEATDAQIDALVYELYGLTEEEIRLVEGR
jgi:hypothetical protein